MPLFPLLFLPVPMDCGLLFTNFHKQIARNENIFCLLYGIDCVSGVALLIIIINNKMHKQQCARIPSNRKSPLPHDLCKLLYYICIVADSHIHNDVMIRFSSGLNTFFFPVHFVFFISIIRCSGAHCVYYCMYGVRLSIVHRPRKSVCTTQTYTKPTPTQFVVCTKQQRIDYERRSNTRIKIFFIFSVHSPFGPFQPISSVCICVIVYK